MGETALYAKSDLEHGPQPGGHCPSFTRYCHLADTMTEFSKGPYQASCFRMMEDLRPVNSMSMSSLSHDIKIL